MRVSLPINAAVAQDEIALPGGSAGQKASGLTGEEFRSLLKDFAEPKTAKVEERAAGAAETDAQPLKAEDILLAALRAATAYHAAGAGAEKQDPGQTRKDEGEEAAQVAQGATEMPVEALAVAPEIAAAANVPGNAGAPARVDLPGIATATEAAPAADAESVPIDADWALPDAKPIKASVVGRETHFAPVVPGAGAPVPKANEPETSAPAAALSAPRPESVAADPRAVADRNAGGAGIPPRTPARAEERALALAAASASAGETVRADAVAPTLQRVGESIAAEAARASAEMRPEASRSAAAASLFAAPLARDPVRILTIQLHPVELGTVTVRLRLNGKTLSAELRASRPETAELLEREHQTLADIVRASGHDVEKLVVHGSGRDSGIMLPSPAANATFAAAGDAPARDSGAQDRGESRGQSDQRQGKRDGQGDEPAADTLRPRGLYV